jgi:hypothetical protein
MEVPMRIHLMPVAVLITLIAIPACAGPSGQHVAQSVGHSAAASSHGSAAAASTASTVVAVPILAIGSVVAVSGVALEEIAAGALVLGTDLARAGAGEPVTVPVVRPNGAPTLD